MIKKLSLLIIIACNIAYASKHDAENAKSKNEAEPKFPVVALNSEQQARDQRRLDQLPYNPWSKWTPQNLHLFEKDRGKKVHCTITIKELKTSKKEWEEFDLRANFHRGELENVETCYKISLKKNTFFTYVDAGDYDQSDGKWDALETSLRFLRDVYGKDWRGWHMNCCAPHFTDSTYIIPFIGTDHSS